MGESEKSSYHPLMCIKLGFDAPPKRQRLRKDLRSVHSPSRCSYKRKDFANFGVQSLQLLSEY